MSKGLTAARGAQFPRSEGWFSHPSTDGQRHRRVNRLRGFQGISRTTQVCVIKTNHQQQVLPLGDSAEKSA